MDLLRRVFVSDTVQGSGEGVRSCAVQGLGGVGKTTFASEYAYRYQNVYELVWWVRAEQAGSMADDLYSLLVALTGQTDFTDVQVLPRLWSELGRHEPWLIIYDNAHDAAVLREYWPSGRGDIVITSRANVWQALVNDVIAMEVFSHDDAVTLLHARTRDDDSHSAAKIADRLGRLPLALVQAAAYVGQTHSSLNHYSSLLIDHLGDVLMSEPPSDYSVPVATTWSISITKADGFAPGARDLLALLAFLASEEIPRRILPQAPTSLSMQQWASDTIAYDRAVGALTRFSLITADAQNLSVHRLVQMSVMLEMAMEEQIERATTAVDVLDELFPEDSGDPALQDRCAQLTPHVLVAAGHAIRLRSDRQVSEILRRAAKYSESRAFLRPAKDMLLLALVDYERRAEEGVAVADTYDELTAVLHHRTELTQALAYSERSIRIRERILGANDPSLVEPLRRFGNVFIELSRLDEADECFQRALQIIEHIHGTESFEAIPLLGGLTWLRYRMGRYRSALELAQRQLVIDDAHSNPDLRATAFIHMNLAAMYHAMGDMDEAVRHDSISMHMFADLDGPDSFEVLKRRQGIAYHLIGRGSTEQAMEMATQAMIGLIEIHEGDHPDLLQALKVRSRAFLATGQPERALSDLNRALDISEAFYDTNHPYVAHVLILLAQAQLAAGDREAASASINRSEAILSSRNYTGHPDYAEILEIRAELALAEGHDSRAAELNSRAADIRRASRE